jgi:hypothetical protein
MFSFMVSIFDCIEQSINYVYAVCIYGVMMFVNKWEQYKDRENVRG